jgi:hypothetical protein
MRKTVLLTHKFVEFIPRELEANTIYVSIPYATAIHNCCCGCGNRVVTPISPADWKLIFDGRSISLEPSIGNWSFPCQSHYWITNNNVVWARRWSKNEISAARGISAHAADAHFGPSSTNVNKPARKTDQVGKEKEVKGGFKKRIKKWFGASTDAPEP